MSKEAGHNQLALLKDIAEALNEANDIGAAMAALLPRLAQVLGLTTAWAFRFDPSRRCFVEVGASGLPPALAADDAAPLKGGWCECQSQFVSGKLNQAVNIVRCSRLRDAEGDKQGLVFHASVPLRSNGKPLGILNVAAQGAGQFDQDVLELLGLIAHQVAIAVDRAGLLSAQQERTRKLQLLSAMSAQLVNQPTPGKLLQTAVEYFVEGLGYEACGIMRGTADDDADLVAAAHQPGKDATEAYRYETDEDQPALPPEQQVILSDARSFLTMRIPQTEYTLRLESRYPFAFNEVDDDIASAFTWHVFAALEYARLHQQSVRSAQWAERRRLAADLHDSVSQRLFSALLLARSASLLTDTPEKPVQTQDILTRIQSLIAESQEEMRALIRALRPAEDRGLIANLQQRLNSLQLQSQTRLGLTQEDCDELWLAPESTDALLKATDEALQNALKHAGAAHVFISVQRTEGQLLLSVVDDGCGFVEGQRSGLGMQTMSERLSAVGGTAKVRSTPGTGTTVLFSIPLEK